MIRLVIFDLDGTLLNTIEDLGEACNHALALHGYPTHPLADYPRLVGNGVNKLIWRAMPESERSDEAVLRIKADFIPFYNTHNRVHTRPYDGIPEVIDEMKRRGIKIAVASNKYHEATCALVSHYFGADTFDVVLGEREGVERKPNPQIVSDILDSEKCQTISREETLYVGDSDVDMQTAKNAGLKSVACSWGFCTRETLENCNPTHLIDNPLDIINLL